MDKQTLDWIRQEEKRCLEIKRDMESAADRIIAEWEAQEAQRDREEAEDK